MIAPPEVDYNRFAKFPREKVTTWFYLAGQALRADYKAHGMKFAAYRITKDIANAMPTIGNKEALKRGEKAGKILLDGGTLDGSGYGYVLGPDLAKTISYFFIHYPLRDWSNLKEVVKGFGPEWVELTKLAPMPADDQIETFYNQIGNIDLASGNVAAQLRKIASMIDPLENRLQSLTKTVTQQKLTIVNNSNENTRLRVAIKKMRDLLARLNEKVEQEKDPGKRDELIKQYKKYQHQLEKLL